MIEASSDGALQAYLDGELTSVEAEAVRRASVRDPAVASRLEELRELERDVSAFLTSPEVAGFEPDLAAAERRIFGTPERHRHPRRWPLARAAGLALALFGGATLVVLAAPVRDWLFPGPTTEEVQPAPESGGESGLTTPLDGLPDFGDTPVATTEVAVLPASGEVRVAVDGLEAGARVTVLLNRPGPAVVRAPVDTHFLTGPGLLELRGASGAVVVALPPGLRHATVDIGGRRYLELRADTVLMPGPRGVRAGDRVTFEVEGRGRR